MSEPEYTDRGATFSPCGLYRYRLWRYWQGGPDTSPLPVVWLMLNPSTADAEKLDPTIRRCVNFARAWGHNGVEIVNLFAYRATDPNAMREAAKTRDVIGPDNDAAILDACRMAGIVVMAYGEHGRLRGRGFEVAALLRNGGVRVLHYLKLTKAGHPTHPLYQPADSRLVKMTLRPRTDGLEDWEVVQT